jgi:hypothetical protein
MRNKDVKCGSNVMDGSYSHRNKSEHTRKKCRGYIEQSAETMSVSACNCEWCEALKSDKETNQVI